MCSAFCLVGFLAMLLLWNEGIAYWRVGLAYARPELGSASLAPVRHDANFAGAALPSR